MTAQVLGVLPENAGSRAGGAESSERVRGGYSVESLWLAGATDDFLNFLVREDAVRGSGSPCDEFGGGIGRPDGDAAATKAGNVREHVAHIFAEPVYVLAHE